MPAISAPATENDRNELKGFGELPANTIQPVEPRTEGGKARGWPKSRYLCRIGTAGRSSVTNSAEKIEELRLVSRTRLGEDRLDLRPDGFVGAVQMGGGIGQAALLQ